jgi:hypothetical protein
MIISKVEAIQVAEAIHSRYGESRGSDGITDRQKLSRIIKEVTGRNIQSEGSLNKIEAQLCTM